MLVSLTDPASGASLVGVTGRGCRGVGRRTDGGSGLVDGCGNILLCRRCSGQYIPVVRRHPLQQEIV